MADIAMMVDETWLILDSPLAHFALVFVVIRSIYYSSIISVFGGS